MTKVKVNSLRPSSADPLKYDDFAHHIAFRSVLSPLVSEYKNGEIIGVLAESWTTSPDGLVWTFKIRPDLRFENGDLITPEIIVRSLIRLGFCMKLRSSEHNLFVNLKGFDSLKSPTGTFEGISFVKDQVIFKLIKAQPKFLHVLSFGLYSIVSPKDWDPKSGAWLNDKSVISSSHYRLKTWTEKTLLLELRPEFLPELRHKNAFQNIEIVWEPNNPGDYDMLYGFSSEQALKDRYSFMNKAESNIGYLYIFSYKTHPVLKNIEARRYIRSKIFEHMRELGIDSKNSFFPLAINGVKPIIENTSDTQKKFSDFSLKLRKWDDDVANVTTFFKSLDHFIDTHKTKADWVGRISFDDYHELTNPNSKDFKVDLMPMSTNISLVDPISDVEFMFLSKEGINLPDLTGEIRAELKKESPDLQRINQALWDQAVIWPLGHFGAGFWAKPYIDYSLLNTLLPPIEFQWIGTK